MLQRFEELRIQGIQHAPSKLLRGWPQSTQILDNQRPPLAVAEQVMPALPGIETEPVAPEDMVQHLRAVLPGAASSTFWLAACSDRRWCVAVIEALLSPVLCCDKLPT